MTKKTLPRVKSPEEVANETEWARRLCLPAVYTRFVGANDVFLFANGVEVGSKTRVYKRGKEVAVLYHFPSLATYERLMALPEAVMR